MLSGGLISKWKEDAFLEMIKASRKRRSNPTQNDKPIDTNNDEGTEENDDGRRRANTVNDVPDELSNSPRALSLTDMQGLFFAWIIGAGTGLCIFAGELVIVRYDLCAACIMPAKT